METSFKGMPFIETPSDVPQIGYLEGHFGNEFLIEYKDIARKDYSNNEFLDAFSWNGDRVIGSNIFSIALANSRILGPQGLRTVTPSDMEMAIRLKILDFRKTYVETGLVLWSEEYSYPKNNTVVKYLASQLKERGAEFSPESPLLISLTGFQLEKSDNDYGLKLRLTDDAHFYNAPVLSGGDKCFDSIDIDGRTGLPITFRDNGSRTLYTESRGLSVFFTSDGRDLSSSYKNLGNHFPEGRIVVVKD